MDDDADTANNYPEQRILYGSQHSHLSDISSQEASPALLGFIHNHTYLSGSGGSSDSNADTYHPYSYKNKLKKQRAAAADAESASMLEYNRQQETRDALLLKERNIQLELSQVINSTADELNVLTQAYELSREQINVIKDIRRRGKNKVAAQVCRKRKMESIDSLKSEVDQLKELKERLYSENKQINNEVC